MDFISFHGRKTDAAQTGLRKRENSRMEEAKIMFENYIPVSGCTELSGAKEDRKAAKRIGQYRVSEKALYI